MAQQGISRRRFLEAMGVGAAAVGVTAAGFGGRVSASPGSPNPDPQTFWMMGAHPLKFGDPEITVRATSANPQDAADVQWALDNVTEGGTIRLSGVFHFSDVDQNGELVYSGVHVHQPFQPWYGDHYLGLAMYYISGTVQRYVGVEVPSPDPDDPATFFVDPYQGPVVPFGHSYAKGAGHGLRGK